MIHSRVGARVLQRDCIAGKQINLPPSVWWIKRGANLNWSLEPAFPQEIRLALQNLIGKRARGLDGLRYLRVLKRAPRSLEILCSPGSNEAIDFNYHI